MIDSIEPKFPEVTVALIGEDGNVGSIMGRVTRAMAQAGVSTKDQQEFRRAVFDCGSYDEVLRLVMETVDVA